MSAVPFDRIAERYDAVWTDSAVGRAQRAQVWHHVDPLFVPGDHVLDIGCGTGADAAHLAARGVRVHATDASPGMIAVCRRLSQHYPGLTTTLMPAEEIAMLPGLYDGALSDFGVLNCVADLRPVVAGLAAKVRRGGRAAICVIGRFCLWETIGFAATLQARKSVRRWRGRAEASMGIPVYYPTVAHLRAVFAPAFELERWMGIGLWPPHGAIDRAFAHLPLARALADHRLLIFTRN